MKSIKNRIKKLLKWWWSWRYWRWASYFIVFIIWLICLPTTLFEKPTSTVLYDTNGKLLGATIAEDGQWRFPYNDNVPEKFKKCIIQFEDRSFESHWGVSIKGITRATIQNFKEGKVVSGGSTLTMQIMRMASSNDNRSVWNKVTEIFQATRAEWRYDKKELLAIYASHAPMGGNVVGLDAASWRYFGRAADQLSWAQTATLAVLPNAPSLMHPNKNRKALKSKRNRLLKRLYDVNEIDETTYKLSIEEPLPEKPYPIPQITPHLLQFALKQDKKGQIVHSTIDYSIQNMASDVVDLHHLRLQQNDINNIAVLIMDTQTGEVLTYIGNTSDTLPDHQPYVDVIQAPRSSGSILKPFLYQALLEKGMIMPEGWQLDIPTYFPGYAPTNYNNTYDGLVPADEAVSRSLNVPTIHMLMEYGVGPFLNRMQKWGSSTLNRSASDYGLSLILGGGEVKLWELVDQYGKLTQSISGKNEVEGIHVFKGQSNTENLSADPGSVWWMLQAMVDVARPDDEKKWEMFSSSQKIAWKTGTSFGFRDAWSIGISPDYVVGIWVGNADGEGRPGIVGGKVAAPILFDVFAGLSSKRDWFKMPLEHMEEVNVCRQSGEKASEFCDKTYFSWVPLAASQTGFCQFHKPYYLSKDKKYRVNGDCYDLSESIDSNMLSLSPMVAKFYQKKHPSYQNLPSLFDACNQGVETGQIAFIYPKKQSHIYLPVNIEGELEKVIVEASHSQSSATLFWYLDDTFYGTTKDIHQMEMQPRSGKHTVSVFDEKGNQESITFEVSRKHK